MKRMLLAYRLAGLVLFLAAFCQTSPAQERGNDDAWAVGAIRLINTAEVNYMTTYPNVGYACTLDQLKLLPGAKPSPEHSGLIDAKFDHHAKQHH